MSLLVRMVLKTGLDQLVQPSVDYGSDPVRPSIDHGSDLVRSSIGHDSDPIWPSIGHGSNPVRLPVDRGSNLVQPPIDHGSNPIRSFMSKSVQIEIRPVKRLANQINWMVAPKLFGSTFFFSSTIADSPSLANRTSTSRWKSPLSHSS